MHSSTETKQLALRSVGKLCSAHWNTLSGEVRFQWARLCSSDEEAEMIDCEFESAAMPGKPHGVLFERIADYRSDNADNQQVGELVDFRIQAGDTASRCFIRFDAVGKVEFTFERSSPLIAPDRN